MSGAVTKDLSQLAFVCECGCRALLRRGDADSVRLATPFCHQRPRDPQAVAANLRQLREGGPAVPASKFPIAVAVRGLITHLETVQIGAAFYVYRVPHNRELDPNDDRLPGLHKSKRAANAAARAIAAETGEELRPTKMYRR